MSGIQSGLAVGLYLGVLVAGMASASPESIEAYRNLDPQQIGVAAGALTVVPAAFGLTGFAVDRYASFKRRVFER